MNENQIINSLGHWYAEYRLPRTLVVKDKNGNELNNGYIVVLFSIQTLDKDGASYLYYYANKNASQWGKENSNAGGHDNITITLPKTINDLKNNAGPKTAQISINEGFYPVAIYEVGQRLNMEVSGTH